MTRILNVVRMQWVNRVTFVVIPALVLSGAFLVSLLIYTMITSEGPKYGGGAQAPLWYFLVIGIQSLTLSFPFSQALSITRREFFFGTTLAAAATALPLSVLYVVGGLIEKATDGWGVNGWMFHLPWIWADGLAGAWLFYFAAPMLFFMVGFCAATVYKRFGATLLTVGLIVVAVLVVIAIALITRFEAWGTIGAWFAGTTITGWGGYLLLAALVLSGFSLLMIRRATP